MEFVPDTINNARNIAFLNKTKNQAKKLFKLAKKNQLKIDIQNLSHAQEILAQINGFPDWHALEKTINNAVLDNHYNSLSITNSHEQIDNPELQKKQLEIYKGIPVLMTEYDAMSFISLNYVSSDYNSFIDFMNDIIKATSFQFNMEFHKVNILIEQNHKKTEVPDFSNAQYFPINNHKKLGLDIESLQKFFHVSYVMYELNNSNFSISANIMVTTDKNMIEEHVKFCSIFNSDKFKEFFALKEVVHYDNNDNCYEIKKFNKNNGKTLYAPSVRVKDNEQVAVRNLSQSLLPIQVPQSNPHFLLTEFMQPYRNNDNTSYIRLNHSKWIFALYLLSQRQHQWKLNVNLLDLSSKEINYFTLSHSANESHDISRVNDKYLQGLYKSLTSDNFNYNVIENDYGKIFPYKNNISKTLPWNTGIPLINREDNVVDYFQPFSSSQTTYINAIWAKPGSGKSVLMNMLNLALCFSPGIERLPRIGIVDIGPSSYGLISLLKESLPIEKRHLVQYHKLKMLDEYCINIFDTQLGCRFPTSEHRSLLSNMLLLLIDDTSLLTTPIGMNGLTQAIIDDMYLQASEKGNPKRYDKGINLRVDAAIKKINFDFDHKTTWWEVVDALFSHNMICEATLAQRYAVPLLFDASASAQNDKIRNIYGALKIETGETLIHYFNRTIIESLNQYKILGRPTTFDISDARIVSLDLDEVAKSGGVQADKQTAVMYMLARYILGKDFKLSPDTLNQMPYPSNMTTPHNIPVEKYKAYHKKRIDDSKEDIKQLCFDEFHRVDRTDFIKEQVIIDMRESRIFNLGVTIASQSLNSFDDYMTQFFSNTFIMDAGNTKDCSKIAETFKLSSYEKDFLLQGRVHGPRSGNPGTFLAKFVTNLGNYSKLVSIPLNTTLGWCLYTTMEDVKIREKLTSKIGYSMAIRFLTNYYPYGIRKIVEKRKEENLIQNKETDMDFIIEQMIEELLAREFRKI